VTVTALCPGPIRTGFEDAAALGVRLAPRSLLREIMYRIQGLRASS
jgi:hypothetical protein